MSIEVQNTNLELSDDDLENVAGGTKTYHGHGHPVNNGTFNNNGTNNGVQVNQNNGPINFGAH
jgi:hypothetical protein